MTEAVSMLVQSALAFTLALLLVALLRRPLRRLAGAQVAYGLWLLVPALAAAPLWPQNPIAPAVLPEALVLPAAQAWDAILSSGGESALSPRWPAVLFVIWLTGAGLMLFIALLRQRRFVRALSPLTAMGDGSFRGVRAEEPMLVGALRPRIVVPQDFERRFSKEEQALVLAHERGHLARGDAPANALALFAVCLFWYHPLAYWAWARFRFDQELACDAHVLRKLAIARRCYADTLLKTQLIEERPGLVPLGCHWKSCHPLKERIAMLKNPLPSNLRRRAGIAAVLLFTATGSYLAWAAQGDAIAGAARPTDIAVELKWTINGTVVLASAADPAHSIRVSEGGEFLRTVAAGPGQTYSTRCTASRPGERPSRAAELARATGQSLQGMLLFDCQLKSNDEVLAKPALMVREGQPGVIEVGKPGTVMRLELTGASAR